MYRYLLIALFLLVCVAAKAQQPDTAAFRNAKNNSAPKNDTVVLKPFRAKANITKEKVYHPDTNHSVRGARIRSMILPGLGQIYNRHGLWWRLPLLYTGLYFTIQNYRSNAGDYDAFLKESEWRAHGRPGGAAGEPLPIYNGQGISNVPDQTIYDFKDQLRRNAQLTLFGLAAIWGVNVIDAYVEAKFIHSYTMDNNLSFKVSPQLMNQPVYASNFNATFTPGLKLTLLFK